MYPRLPPRLQRLFPSNPVFFVTLCTYRRQRVLASDAVHTSFIQFAERAYADRSIAVGRYVIMPDHVHLFVTGPDDFDLGRWIGTLKQVLAKARVREQAREPFWQRGFFDHVLRSEESYGQKWNYVRDNPVRARLVEKTDDWPYAGEIIVIDRL
jgi:putative transposase